MEDKITTTTEVHPLHSLAILLSRSLNTLNPNDLLAERVQALSKSTGSLPNFTKALSTFGKFNTENTLEIYELCQTLDVVHQAFLAPPGLTVVDSSDVLLSDEPSGKAGLTIGGAGEKHVFKQPVASHLGLDRLAMEKRRERESEGSGSSRPSLAKKIKYDEDEDDNVRDTEFKSKLILFVVMIIVIFQFQNLQD